MGNGVKKHEKKIKTSTTTEQIVPNVALENKDKSITEIIVDNMRRRTPEELAEEERELTFQQKRVDADTLTIMAPVQDELKEKATQLQDNDVSHLFKPYQPPESKQTTGCFSFIFSLFCCKKQAPENNIESKQSLLRN